MDAVQSSASQSLEDRVPLVLDSSENPIRQPRANPHWQRRYRVLCQRPQPGRHDGWRLLYDETRQKQVRSCFHSTPDSMHSAIADKGDLQDTDQ